MFTGIVQGKGKLIGLEKGQEVQTLTVQLPDATGLERGASVALNGVCLTALLLMSFQRRLNERFWDGSMLGMR
jgi:riboflavin synthase alpha subunit